MLRIMNKLIYYIMSSDKVLLSEQYCSILKRILQFYHEESNNKDITYTHIRRGLLFLKEFPIDAVELTGVKLWQYKDIITLGNLGKIKYENLNTNNMGIPESQKDIADDVFNTVLQTWKNLTGEHKKLITADVQELLKIYTKIIIIDRKK